MESRSVRGMMQLQSSSEGSRSGATRPDPTRPDPTRPDQEYGILSLKWTVKSTLKDFGYHCELWSHMLARGLPGKELQFRYNEGGEIFPDHARK